MLWIKPSEMELLKDLGENVFQLMAYACLHAKAERLALPEEKRNCA